MVAREAGVRSGKQVAKVDGVADLAFARACVVDKAVHFANGIRHKHGEVVVAVFQPVDDTGGDGIDIFQHRGVFDSADVARGKCLDMLACEDISETFGITHFSSCDCQERLAVEGDFFGVAWTGDDEHLVGVDTVTVDHIVGDDLVFVGYYTFDSRNDKFFGNIDGDFRQVAFEVRRRHHHKEGVGFGTSLVNIGGEIDTVDVEFDIAQIGGIVTQTEKIFDTVGTTHIPHDSLAVGEQDFGKGCSPTAAAHDDDFSRESVFSLIFLLFRSKK